MIGRIEGLSAATADWARYRAGDFGEVSDTGSHHIRRVEAGTNAITSVIGVVDGSGPHADHLRRAGLGSLPSLGHKLPHRHRHFAR